MDKVLSMMGLATKAGLCVSGDFQVEDAIRKKKAVLVILAENASDNTRKKFTDKTAYYDVELCTYGSKEEFGRALGKRGNRAVAAILDKGFSDSIKKYIAK